MKTPECSKRIENIVGKEKLAVMRNFSFFHSVFKRLELQTRKNHGLIGKGLTLPSDKFWDLTNVKAFVVDISIVAKIIISHLVYQHFLPFPTMFSRGVFFWVVKSRDCVVKVDGICLSKGGKHCGRVKRIVSGIFSFSYNVFRRLHPPGCQNSITCGVKDNLFTRFPKHGLPNTTRLSRDN